MNIYSGFSKVYDDLVSDTNSFYVEKLINFINNNNLMVKNIHELACGTGNIALNLSNRGFNVTGSDISKDMISIANNKNHLKKCIFLCKDMRKIENSEIYDMVYCFLDGLTYLENIYELNQVFKSVNLMLDYKGAFVFDIFSYEGYKMTNSKPIEKKYIEVNSGFIFWKEVLNKKSLIVDIDIYLKKLKNRFEDYHEQHIQRMYNDEEIDSLLKENFTVAKKESLGIRKIYYCIKK